MKCSKCGKEIAKDSNFCEYCGNPIKKSRKKMVWITLIAIFVSLFIGVMIFGIGFGNKTVYYVDEMSDTINDSAGVACDSVVHAEGELQIYYKVIVSEAKIYEYLINSKNNTFMEELDYTYKKGSVFQGEPVHLEKQGDFIMFSWLDNGNQIRGFIRQSDVIVDHYERDF